MLVRLAGSITRSEILLRPVRRFLVPRRRAAMVAVAGQGLIARSLLQHVPVDKRAAVVRDAVWSLDQDGAGDLNFVTALLAEHPEPALHDELVTRLIRLVEAGHVEQVLPIVRNDVDLGEKVLDRVSGRLDQQVTRAGHASKGFAVTPNERVLLLQQCEYNASEENEAVAAPLSALERLFSFARRAVAIKGRNYPAEPLFFASLVGTNLSDEAISTAARGLLASILSSQAVTEGENVELLWTCIKDLVCGQSSFHQGIGYSIWLLAVNKIRLPTTVVSDVKCWQLLHQGLRGGDAERRKQCLGILRQVVALAAQHDSTKTLVCRAAQLDVGKFAQGNDAHTQQGLKFLISLPSTSLCRCSKTTLQRRMPLTLI